jgi:PhnB protein
MSIIFKPEQYNSLSPYLIVNGAKKLGTLLQAIFGAVSLRQYERSDGSIMHMEIKIDDTVLMLADSTEQYKPQTTMLHVYVPDVMHTFRLAIGQGCTAEEEPVLKDTDKRGAFKDFAGNYWAVSTQIA